jgi:hypothetical protein
LGLFALRSDASTFALIVSAAVTILTRCFFVAGDVDPAAFLGDAWQLAIAVALRHFSSRNAKTWIVLLVVALCLCAGHWISPEILTGRHFFENVTLESILGTYRL